MKNQKLFLSATLIILAILFRTVWHIGDNIEFVTAAALVAGAYLGLKYAIVIPLIAMISSDLIIGNTNIFIFTWSAYAIIGIMGFLTLKVQSSQPKADQPRAEKFKVQSRDKTKIIFRIIKATGIGVIAGFWFYLWTNFGVWLLDSWGMYTKDVSGLLSAYIMGFPFLKLNLTGNLFFIPLTFAIMEIAPVMLNNLNIKTLKAVKLKA